MIIASIEPSWHNVPELMELPLLAGLQRHELTSLLGKSIVQHIRPGELLFREGEAPKGLTIIAEGAGEIFRTGRGRWSEQIGKFEPGDVLAIASTLTGRHHVASAQATVPTEILQIPRSEVRRLCRRRPEIALRLIQQLEGRLDGLVRCLSRLETPTPPQAQPLPAPPVEYPA